jgi:hypothetical protein
MSGLKEVEDRKEKIKDADGPAGRGDIIGEKVVEVFGRNCIIWGKRERQEVGLFATKKVLSCEFLVMSYLKIKSSCFFVPSW